MAENPGDDVRATLAAPRTCTGGSECSEYESRDDQTSTPRTAPVDYLVVGLRADKANFSGEIVSELTALIDSNTIRVLDAVMIRRADDRSGEATEMREADDSEIASHARSSGTAILLAEEDIKEIGASLVPDVGGAVRPAVRRSGAERLGSGRIPAQALIASVAAGRGAALEGA